MVTVLSFGQTRLNVGAKNFTEQYIVSSMISHLLEDAGFRVTENFGMSSFVARSAPFMLTTQVRPGQHIWVTKR